LSCFHGGYHSACGIVVSGRRSFRRFGQGLESRSVKCFAFSGILVLIAIGQHLAYRRSQLIFKHRILKQLLLAFVLSTGIYVFLVAFPPFARLLVFVGLLMFSFCGFALCINDLRRSWRSSESRPVIISTKSLPLLLANTEHTRRTHLHPSVPRQRAARTRLEKARQRITSLGYFLTATGDDKSVKS
jgi:hypothetical protein